MISTDFKILASVIQLNFINIRQNVGKKKKYMFMLKFIFKIRLDNIQAFS